MTISTRFQAAVQTLADLAAPTNPPYVAVQAASRLVNLLSPANPRHHDIMRLLNQPGEAAPAADADQDATNEADPSSLDEEDEPP